MASGKETAHIKLADRLEQACKMEENREVPAISGQGKAATSGRQSANDKGSLRAFYGLVRLLPSTPS